MSRAAAKKDMPLLDHITELRRLVIVSVVAVAVLSIASFAFYDRIIELLYRPLRVLEESGEESLLYINTIFEGFLTRLKVSVLAGFVLSFPVHLLNVIRFTFPGLSRRERRIVSVTLVCSAVFVVLSFLYSYYKIIPISIGFLTGEGFVPDRIGMLLSFSGNIFYILQFMLVALVVFQIPIILEVLMAMNVLSRRTLWRAARYLVVSFFVLAAIVTPPDFITQLSLALPLTLLFFLTLLIAKICGFGSK
jgi:sec-independent protein translocase protein TatC